MTVAQLAMLHYWVTGLGVKLPGLAAAGDGIPDSMPAGFDAITSGTWPVQGWAQVLLFCSALEVLAPQKEDKAPGDVQPDTPAFPKLDDKSPEEALDLQNKEVRWLWQWVHAACVACVVVCGPHACRLVVLVGYPGLGLLDRTIWQWQRGGDCVLISRMSCTCVRAVQINNGRLAMVAWTGATVGALLTGGEQPLTTLLSKLGQ